MRGERKAKSVDADKKKRASRVAPRGPSATCTVSRLSPRRCSSRRPWLSRLLASERARARERCARALRPLALKARLPRPPDRRCPCWASPVAGRGRAWSCSKAPGAPPGTLSPALERHTTRCATALLFGRAPCAGQNTRNGVTDAPGLRAARLVCWFVAGSARRRTTRPFFVFAAAALFAAPLPHEPHNS